MRKLERSRRREERRGAGGESRRGRRRAGTEGEKRGATEKGQKAKICRRKKKENLPGRRWGRSRSKRKLGKEKKIR